MINPALLIRLRKFKLKKFVKRGGEVQKLKAQKIPKPQVIIKQKKRQLFRWDPKKKSISAISAPFNILHPGIKDLALKAGQTTEKITLKRLAQKFPKRFATTKGSARALKLAQLKGLKKVKTLSNKYKIQGLTSVKDRPKTFYKAKKGSGLPKGMTLEEMGWAPHAELSTEAKAVFVSKLPKTLLKKHRKTLSKIYAKPKTWKKRAELKRYYRGQIKTELKAAKFDRAIFRTQTVQKLDPKTGRYKTIRKYKKYTY